MGDKEFVHGADEDDVGTAKAKDDHTAPLSSIIEVRSITLPELMSLLPSSIIPHLLILSIPLITLPVWHQLDG